jgi:hypothetical protein
MISETVLNMSKKNSKIACFCRRKLGLKPSEKLSKYQDHKIVIKKLEKRVEELKSTKTALEQKVLLVLHYISISHFSCEPCLFRGTIML